MNRRCLAMVLTEKGRVWLAEYPGNLKGIVPGATQLSRDQRSLMRRETNNGQRGKT